MPTYLCNFFLRYLLFLLGASTSAASTSPIYRPNKEYVRKRRRVQISWNELNDEIDQENADPDYNPPTERKEKIPKLDLICKYQTKKSKELEAGVNFNCQYSEPEPDYQVQIILLGI